MKSLDILQDKRLLLGIGYTLVFLLGLILFQTSKIAKSPEGRGPKVEQKVENGALSLASFSFFGKSPDPITEIQKADWKLKGIIFNQNHEGIAILEINQKEKSLKEGDNIDSRTKLHQIDREKIIIIQDGQKHTQSLFKPAEGQTSAQVRMKSPAPEQNPKVSNGLRGNFERFRNRFENRFQN